ncbi:hypothetical protein V2W30_40520 (plasmid) [Streptomyces sp. Q6]|uniref:Uncharacterized protein n=1 Tax=Streptomyces citrinus TaxID=3118173 RepID=A0ACD5AQI0_9ACTN
MSTPPFRTALLPSWSEERSATTPHDVLEGRLMHVGAGLFAVCGRVAGGRGQLLVRCGCAR